MAIQPPQRFELDDLAHVEREARTIYAPGATPGDVLVVQSDHSLIAAPGGGSMPHEVIRVPVAFDTPGILTGLTVWTPDVGDAMLSLSGLSIPATPWNGTSPRLTLYPHGLPVAGNEIMQGGIDGPNPTPWGGLPFFQGLALVSDSGDNGTIPTFLPFVSKDGTAVDVIVDDGSGGDPGSDQGEGALIFVVIKGYGLITATP